jgi:hypothetical protein
VTCVDVVTCAVVATCAHVATCADVVTCAMVQYSRAPASYVIRHVASRVTPHVIRYRYEPPKLRGDLKPGDAEADEVADYYNSRALQAFKMTEHVIKHVT